MASINTEYAAFVSDGDIWFHKLTSLNEEPRHLVSCKTSTLSGPVLALSPIQSNLLAISDGHQILIHDLGTLSLKSTIPGIGRRVTAVSWSYHNATVLAAGFVDGTICVWDLGVPNRPRSRLAGGRKACHVLEFNARDENLLASINGGTISVWNLVAGSLQLVCTIGDKVTYFDTVVWQPGSASRLVAASSNAELRFYDVSDAVSSSVAAKNSDSSSSSSDNVDGVFGVPDELRETIRLVSSTHMDNTLNYIHWFDDHLFLVLARHGSQAFFYRVEGDHSSTSELWSCWLRNKHKVMQLQISEGTAVAVTVGLAGIETNELPTSVLKAAGPQHGSKVSSFLTTPASSTSALDSISRGPITNGEPRVLMSATMTPFSMLSPRHSALGFAKTSKQLQQRRRSLRPVGPEPEVIAKSKAKPRSDQPSTPPADRPMISSLELPKLNEEEIGSPMPFLSPSIPLRRPSQNGIPPLEDSFFRLPPTSIPSTAATASDANDSDDSDDETFVDALQGSATFLPGGINVPLPKACGALFAPNGQLLTYFPPKPKQTSVRGNLLLEDGEESGQTRHIDRVARLFPTFGNLTDGLQIQNDDLDSDDTSLFDGDVNGISLRPNFVLQPSSYPSQQSWKSRISPIKQDFGTQHVQHKVVVRVYEIDDGSTSLSSQHQLAKEYRLLTGEGESGSGVCEQNASVAEAAGQHDTAQIWKLLTMLLEERVPLELLSGSLDGEDILTVVQRSKVLTRSDSGVDLVENGKHNGSYGKLRWSDNPFGSLWLVRQLFDWAEERSDTQLLACMSAVLAQTIEEVPMQSATIHESFFKNLPAYSPEYETDITIRPRQSHAGIRSVPILRTNSAGNSSTMYESPIKTHRTSNTSSRNPSQPTTPYLGSTSSTPPFSLPPLPRQGSRLSTSGSASPEYHRSSFSAAAKYYAQSITDKFSSFGTSPPIRKTGTSPSTSNELSSSLPSGSWSKSVSFASSSATGNTARGSLLSKSYDGQSDEEAYDSDKTIEDSSIPYAPRSPSGPISVISKNQHAFTDDVSGSAKANLIPEDMAVKCHIWCQYYAEQLRSWSLLEQAAELEKIVGITTDDQALSTSEPDFSNNGVIPVASNIHRGNTTCAICLNVVRRVEQMCPSCLHVSHLSCLEEYSADVSDGEFTCPTSCGCNCAGLAFAVLESRPQSPQNRPAFKKKASFTDPRRWRARVEGDSW